MSLSDQFRRRLSREQRERHVDQQREESEVLDTFVRRMPLQQRLEAERQILETPEPVNDTFFQLGDEGVRSFGSGLYSRAAQEQAGGEADFSGWFTTQEGEPTTPDVEVPDVTVPDVNLPEPDLPSGGDIRAAALIIGGLLFFGFIAQAFAKGAGRGAAS